MTQLIHREGSAHTCPQAPIWKWCWHTGTPSCFLNVAVDIYLHWIEYKEHNDGIPCPYEPMTHSLIRYSGFKWQLFGSDAWRFQRTSDNGNSKRCKHKPNSPMNAALARIDDEITYKRPNNSNFFLTNATNAAHRTTKNRMINVIEWPVKIVRCDKGRKIATIYHNQRRILHGIYRIESRHSVQYWARAHFSV